MRTELLDRGLLPEGRLLCAVSGGLDSMCLLQLCLEEGLDLVCAHFDHGLRPGSAGDCIFVQEFCQERGIPCITERWTPGEARSEDAARAARYAFLERARQAAGASCIATAHTADDQVETMLLQLCRGAGSRGLSGIPPRRGTVIRPLLGVSRSALEDFAAQRGLPHVEDETNEGDGYARNRLRHHVLPVLGTVNPAFREHFSACARHLGEDDDCLYAQAEAFLTRNPQGLPAAALLALHPAVRGRVYRLAAGRGLECRHIPALDDLCAGVDGRRISLPGGEARREDGRLVFGMEERPAGIDAAVLFPGQTLCLPALGLRISCKNEKSPAEIHNSFNTFFFSCESIYGNMTLRSRQAGDRLRPPGRGCTKTLKKLFAEARVPPRLRDRIPVLADDRGVLAVYGFGQDQRTLAAPGAPVFAVCFEKIGEDSEI